MFKFFSFVVVIMLFSACQKDGSDDETKVLEYLSEESYDVYGLILNPLSSVNIVISSTNSKLNCAEILQMNNDSLGVSDLDVTDCIDLNLQEYAFDIAKMQSGGLKLVSNDEFEAAESDNDIMQEYGAVGIFQFGAPLFFENNTKAIYEINYSCGVLCGNSSIIIAEKQNNIWSIKHYIVTRISK